MIVEQTTLPGVLLIEPDVVNDSRGFLLESFQRQRYSAEGIKVDFIQDNHCRSVRGTLRGLHFQSKFPQAKLIYVSVGAIFDVAVDIRLGSPSYSQWYGAHLNEDNHRQLYIPEGFAHGFCVLSEVADIHYKFSDYYNPSDECGVIWSDPKIGIDWPIENPILSERDTKHLTLGAISEDKVPCYEFADSDRHQEDQL